MGFQKKTEYYRGTVYEWNLPTGFTCPFALECLVKVDRFTGKMDNKSNAYRCYAASAERFPGVRESRWRNFEFVKRGGMPRLSKEMKAVRIHSSGDFFSQAYFDKWLHLATVHPHVEFWAYTKSLTYWAARLDYIPDNLVLTASYGGRSDELIKKHNLKHAIVVDTIAEAHDMPIDYNDNIARARNVNFYLINNNK